MNYKLYISNRTILSSVLMVGTHISNKLEQNTTQSFKYLSSLTAVITILSLLDDTWQSFFNKYVEYN